MEPRPYVGVTGPVSKEEVEAVIREFDAAGYSMSSPHVPMLGFVVTCRQNHLAQRKYKGLEGLPALLEAAKGRVLPAVHFSTTDAPDWHLGIQVKEVFKTPIDSTKAPKDKEEPPNIYSAGLCRTIQLNIPWPHWGQVKTIKEDLPEMQIVLRIGREAMPKKPADVSDIVRQVTEYGSSITYVSINPTGPDLNFDINKVLMLYRELRERTPNLILGFAGGLTGENVEERVRALSDAAGTSDFCLNAERGLKDKSNGDVVLSLPKVGNFVQAAHRVVP